MSSSFPLPAPLPNGETFGDFFEMEKSCTSLKSIGLAFDRSLSGFVIDDKSIGVSVLEVPGMSVIFVL